MIAIVSSFSPRPAQASLGTFTCSGLNISSISSTGQKVPVQDSSVDTMKEVKCIWDGIAWQLAHEALHTLTTSVVDWINSGFEGNPSFLTNPESYLLDTADSITGAFISSSGELSELCSPFSVNVRLGLALSGSAGTSGTSGTKSKKYSCTLSTIIANAQKSSVNVNGQVTLNGKTVASGKASAGTSGATVDGFVNGDFSQGGWPAFITMVSEPQNNAFGAYLQAKSDLDTKIETKKNSVNFDLSLGAGFMSSTKCSTISEKEALTRSDVKITSSGGVLKYQICSVETPGSVISAALNKQLGAPTDELNLTSEINQVVSALFSTLIKTVLSDGLYSSSQSNSSSGGTVTSSYISQLSNDSSLKSNFTNLKSQAVESMHNSYNVVSQVSTYREQALNTIKAQQTAYNTTQQCIANKLSSTNTTLSTETRNNLQNRLTEINTAISTYVSPRVATYQVAANSAKSNVSLVQEMETSLNNTTSADDLSTMSIRYSSQLSALPSSAGDLNAAKASAEAATTEAANLQKLLTPFQDVCSGNSNSTSNSQSFP